MDDLRAEIRSLDLDLAGRTLHSHVVELYPICRSITGSGLRQTLRWVDSQIPLQLHEVASGKQVLDWTVPPEWNIRDAYINDPSGKRIVDFQKLNLHVVNYSVPVDATMTLDELAPHLHSLPDRPTLVPYRTSFYEEGWGFCLSHDQRSALAAGNYDVRIDSTLSAGSLTYGECVLAGETGDEVLISTHACHPSLANDNLSGIVVATMLAQIVARIKHRYTYRFLFIPATIGAITWLALNEFVIPRVKHGIVLSGVGDPGGLTYKRSRRSEAEIDRAFEYVLQASGLEHRIVDFEPYGYDERQFCSPGFDMPIGNLSRTPYGTYPEYHTSGDNPDFVVPEALAESLQTCLSVIEILEGNRSYVNLSPKGEPQLGRRGLLQTLGGAHDRLSAQKALLWVLSGSDGESSLLDIAARSRVPFSLLQEAAEALLDSGLLARSHTTSA